MKKVGLGLFLAIIAIAIRAEIDFAQYFEGKSGCFILYNLNQNRIVVRYNPPHCAKRVSPGATFNIPLSLMAYDQKLISNTTLFKWNGEFYNNRFWNRDQTPRTWLENSVNWVSKELIHQLGDEKIKKYIKYFNYGNHNTTKEIEELKGLTESMLIKVLKISAEEQLIFLKALVHNQLPVSPESLTETKANMYLETSPGGWKVYGKMGSDYSSAEQRDGKTEARKEAWFLGFIEKPNLKYIFVTHFTELFPPRNNEEEAGIIAKKITGRMLTRKGLF